MYERSMVMGVEVECLFVVQLLLSLGRSVAVFVVPFLVIVCVVVFGSSQ